MYGVCYVFFVCADPMACVVHIWYMCGISMCFLCCVRGICGICGVCVGCVSCVSVVHIQGVCAVCLLCLWSMCHVNRMYVGYM